MSEEGHGDNIWEAATLDLTKDEDDSFHRDEENKGSPVMFADEDRDDDRTPSPVDKEPNDPAQVLQLSQPFFVADTEGMDEDVSVMIPPTPSEVPFIVPGTPSDDGDKVDESQTLLDDKSAELHKQLCFDADDDDDDDDEWGKPTQPMFTAKQQHEKEASFEQEKADPDAATYANDPVSDDGYDDGPTQKRPIAAERTEAMNGHETKNQSPASQINQELKSDDAHSKTPPKEHTTSPVGEEEILEDGYDDGPTQKRIPVSHEREPKSNDNAEDDEDDDDWHLRLTATESTLDALQAEMEAVTQKAERHKTKISDFGESVKVLSPSNDVQKSPEHGTIDITESDDKDACHSNDIHIDEGEGVQDTKPPAEKSKSMPVTKQNLEESSTEKKSAKVDCDDDDDDDMDDEIGPSQSSGRSGIHGESAITSSASRIEKNPSSVSSEGEVDDKTLCIPSSSPEGEAISRNTLLVLGTEPESFLSAQLPKEDEVTETIQETDILRADTGSEKEIKSTSETTSSDEKDTASLNPPFGNFSRPATYTRLSKTPRKLLTTKAIHRMSTSSPAVMRENVKNIVKTDSKLGVLNYQRMLGSFSDTESHEKLLHTIGISVDNEKLEFLMSHPIPSSERVLFKKEIRVLYSIVETDNAIYEKYSSLDELSAHGLQQVEISPINSSSTTKSSSFSSTPSGGMGDISCSQSSNSSNVSHPKAPEMSSIQRPFESVTEVSQRKKSPAKSLKKSPAKSTVKTAVSLVKGPLQDKKSSQEDFRNPMVVLSPLKPTKRAASRTPQDSGDKAVPPKPKRGRPPAKLSASKRTAASAKLSSESEEIAMPKQRKAKKNQKPSPDDPISSVDMSTSFEPDDDAAMPSSTVSTGNKAGTSGIKTAASPVKKSQNKKGAPESRRGSRKKRDASAGEKVEGSPAAANQRLRTPVPELAEDSSGDPAPFGSILPGVRVMARYNDGFYYPGVVQSQEADGKWCVLFDDGALITVTQESLLKISLLQCGAKVHAMSPDGCFDPGTVSSHYREGNSVGYVIEHFNGVIKKYPRASVILSSEQGRLIANTRPTAPPSLTINLDNIVGGKRKRKSTIDTENVSESTPAKETFPKATPKPGKRKAKADPIVSAATVPITTEPSATEMTSAGDTATDKEVPDDDKPLSTRQKQAKQPKGPKGRKKGQKKASHKAPSLDAGDAAMPSELPESKSTVSETSKAAIEEESSSAGAVPIGSSKLFQGYAFLLSQAVRKPEAPTQSGGKETENDSADCFEDYVENEVKPYNKEVLCKQIVFGGGIVLDTFEEALKCTQRRVFLLANTFLRTIKYLQCVSANIPCIKHYWIHNCTVMKKILLYTAYLLPAGHSIITNDTITWHHKTNIFEGLKIVLTAEKKRNDFVNIWSPLMQAAKADIVQKWSPTNFSVTGTSSTVNVIVTNASCPNNIVAAAKRRKIPLVSYEWVIQCIISGTQLAYDAHPKFRHDFTE